MNKHNKDKKQSDNMELLKQQASACGPGCDCNATATPGKIRWVVGVIVLAAAGVMVVHAMVKSDGKPTQASAPAFTDPAASPTATGTGATVTTPEAAPAVAETSVGTTVGAFSELNAAAANMTAVFVFLPAKEETSGNPPSAMMKSAARMIEAQGVKCGLFTLKAGTPDYVQVAAQVSPPAVLAMVKGGGMSAITGDVTESKLVQGFVAASKAGGCGPSAGAGCCPK